VTQLAELFRRLGAPEPEGWAQSQVDEGINQLHRYLFLRQAWSNVISEDDLSWMDKAITISTAHPDRPFSGIGHALRRLLAAGVSREDLVDLTRGMQARLLFDMCYQLDDPALVEKGLENIGWSLVETDDNLEPTNKTVGGLHESVLETDPTGREMRPRKSA